MVRGEASGLESCADALVDCFRANLGERATLCLACSGILSLEKTWGVRSREVYLALTNAVTLCSNL